MILRLIAHPTSHLGKTFTFEHQIKIRKLHSSKTNFTYFFHLMLKEIKKKPPSEFEAKVVRFVVFRIEYWTMVNGKEKFQQIKIPFYWRPKQITPLNKKRETSSGGFVCPIHHGRARLIDFLFQAL